MKHVVAKIPAWLAGELEPDEAAALESHLGTCPDCAAEAEATRRLWDRLGEADAVAAPPAAASAWPAIRARTVGAAEGHRWRRATTAAAALAAGLILAVILPGDGHRDRGSADQAVAEGSSFWFQAESGTALGSSWLAVADEGSGR